MELKKQNQCFENIPWISNRGCFFNTDLILELGTGSIFKEMPEISIYVRLCGTVASVCKKKM